jgi:hypothetical protein
MDQSTDTSDWQQFLRAGFKLRFSYPTVTPEGHEVDLAEEESEGASRVHLTSRDSQEIYVEITHFAGLTPDQEYAHHRPYLEQRFGAGSVGEAGTSTLGGFPVWTYAFRWDQGERSVILFNLGGDTYRIIYDPRSPLNEQIISTISVLE